MHRIISSDNLEALGTLDSGIARLVYIDPPFNTGAPQTHQRVSVTADDAGQRVGFGGRRYRTTRIGSMSFADCFSDYMAFLEPRLTELKRVLAPDGSLFLHVDPRESHYCKVLLDGIFGRESFINEIIWAYDFGGRSTRRWPRKHDVIFWYAVDPSRYVFDRDQADRIPYMAPGLAGPEKAKRGKFPTDVWWHTIVPTSGAERTGYPTQKPLGLIERIVKVHSEPGDLCLDCFAGSGTLGEAAAKHDRRFLLIDEHPEAIAVMRQRLAPWSPSFENLSSDHGEVDARNGAAGSPS